MKKIVCLIASLFACSAHAIPITLEFSGTGSGSLGLSSFQDTNFNIKIFGNTDNVQNPSVNLDLQTGLSSLFTIDGVGQGSFTDPLFVFGGAGENYVGFGTSPGNGNLIAFLDPDNSLVAFDLMSNFGPIAEINDDLLQFINVGTTAGDLTFNTMPPVTFIARISSVPEPTSIVLLSLGFAGIGFSRIKKTTNFNNKQ